MNAPNSDAESRPATPSAPATPPNTRPLRFLPITDGAAAVTLNVVALGGIFAAIYYHPQLGAGILALFIAVCVKKS